MSILNYMPTEDRYLMTRAELSNKMAALLGGRAAERLAFGELSTGAQDDLERVTAIARTMVTRYGMNETLGQVVYDSERPTFLDTGGLPMPAPHLYSEQTACQIDDAVRDLVAKAYDRAVAILEMNRSLLDETAQRLLAQETLTAEELPVVPPYEA